ncbi:MAG: transposase [Candidatus Methanoculleus thermohydrogenotrophicum]|nr:transposase [Candidatus Methanoculleus thermohydrogenotrophicum]
MLKCHLNAFEYFGGYTDEILYDNIKTVILKRALRADDNQWNPKFEDFFRHYGFVPKLCKPYCPQTKGKVENSIGFMKRDFLLGGTFTSLENMNRQVRHWCDCVNSTPHGTTYEVPFDRLRLEPPQESPCAPTLHHSTRRAPEDLERSICLIPWQPVFGALPLCRPRCHPGTPG